MCRAYQLSTPKLKQPHVQNVFEFHVSTQKVLYFRILDWPAQAEDISYVHRTGLVSLSIYLSGKVS